MAVSYGVVTSMFEFRQATEEDFEGICNLIQNEEELFWVYPKGTYPWTVSQIKEIARVRKELTVAAAQNEIVGFSNFYNYEPRKLAFIGNVIVDKSVRSRGVGRTLVSYMMKMAYEKHNLPEVRLEVFSDNIPALLLYTKLGFVPYEVAEMRNPQGYRVASIHMKRERRNGEI